MAWLWGFCLFIGNLGTCVGSPPEGRALLCDLEALVAGGSVCDLPGCPMKLDVFIPLLKRAQSRGYVCDSDASYVLNGFTKGFDLGVRRELLYGTRVFSNYPTAVNARESVTAAVASRVTRHKTINLGAWSDVKQWLQSYFGDYFVFPMGAVPKPHQPEIMRPTSDHTRTGLNAATILGILGHSLDAYKRLEYLFSRHAWMTVADVDDAFSYIPLIPWLWAYMLFRWFNTDDDSSDSLYVYLHLFADFGTRGAPGTFKIILVNVFVGIAQSEFVLTIPIVVYVDDVALIADDEDPANDEMANFQSFTTRCFGLLWKALKMLTAAQVQLYVGFWWDSHRLTRTLPTPKLHSYLSTLLDACRSMSLTLKERQSLAGKMQRGIMTLPPGAACYLVSCYSLAAGLVFGWQRRRTTRKERGDYKAVHDLLELNAGKGYYSYANFVRGPEFRSDACKSRAFAGGGWVVNDGTYSYYRYGSSASRKPIDYLEGDSVVRCCTANAPKWKGCIVKCGIDNTSFECSLASGRSRVDRLNDLLRQLFALQIHYEFVLEPYWISSEDNVHADLLSRDHRDQFLDIAHDFVLPGKAVVAHTSAGSVVTFADCDYTVAMSALRQTLKTYRSNITGDGPSRLFILTVVLLWERAYAPSRGAGVGGDAQLLSIPFDRTSIFNGCPPELLDRLDEVMDNRLRPSSLRKAASGFARWVRFCDVRGWPHLISSGDHSRGGRLAAWILSMVDDSALVFASISTYVWGMRTMHTLHHHSDPAMGVEFFRELMRAVSVLTSVPGVPRKRVSHEVLAAILEDIYRNHWNDLRMVQLGLMVLALYFSFSRVECPCPTNFTGPLGWDSSKHWQVGDFALRRRGAHWVLWIRFKGIKQDPRMERPGARYEDADLPSDLHSTDPKVSKDWVPLGDVPSVPHFSVATFYQRHVQLLARVRGVEEPMFLAADGVRPYTYSAFSSDFSAACLAHGGSQEDKPHGIRVAGYFASKRANGESLTVAHGGWSEHSDGHSRYDRFQHSDVLGIPAGMVGVGSVFDGVRELTASRVSRGATGTPDASAPPPRPGRPDSPPGHSDSSSGGDDSDVEASRSEHLPEGFSQERKVTPQGRAYYVYHAPDGRRFESLVACWRYAATGASAAPQSRSDAAGGVVLRSSPRSDAGGIVQPSPHRSGRSSSPPSRSRSQRRPRGGVCGEVAPDGTFCTFSSGHLGLHSFQADGALGRRV